MGKGTCEVLGYILCKERDGRVIERVEAGRSKLTANRVVGNPFSVEAAWMHDPINAPFPLRESIETLARGE